MTEKQEKMKKKCEKDFPEFVDIASNLTVEELDRELLRHAKYREETLSAQQSDEDLNNARALAKELSGPYTETINALKLKTAYLHLLMAEKQPVDG